MNSKLPSRNQLSITIGTHPSGDMDLSHDIRLLKTSLLYADHVKFCSISSSFLYSLIQLDKLSIQDLTSFFARATQNSEAMGLLLQYEGLKNKKHRSSKELIALKKLNELFKFYGQEAKKHFAGIKKKVDLASIESAIKSGFVELELFDGNTNDEMIEKFLNVLTQSVLLENSYPLFDDKMGKLVNTIINDRKIPFEAPSISRAKQVGLTSDLFLRLPSFDDATIDEILDIRKELYNPLIRFRAGIIQFSEDLKSVPWQENFSQEAEQIYRKSIQPAMLELEENIKSNTLLGTLVPQFFTKETAGSSVMGMLLAQASHLPEIMLPAALTAGVTVASLGAVKEWREKNAQIQANQLYFYYKAGEKLSR